MAQLSVFNDEISFVDYTTMKDEVAQDDATKKSRCPYEDGTILWVVWIKDDKTNTEKPCLPKVPYALDNVRTGKYLFSVRLTDGTQEWDANLTMFKSARGYDHEGREQTSKGLVEVWRDTNKQNGIVVEALKDAMTNKDFKFVLNRTSFKKKDKDNRLYPSSVCSIAAKKS